MLPSKNIILFVTISHGCHFLIQEALRLSVPKGGSIRSSWIQFYLCSSVMEDEQKYSSFRHNITLISGAPAALCCTPAQQIFYERNSNIVIHWRVFAFLRERQHLFKHTKISSHGRLIIQVTFWGMVHLLDSLQFAMLSIVTKASSQICAPSPNDCFS